jgi:hypothetical protein
MPRKCIGHLSGFICLGLRQKMHLEEKRQSEKQRRRNAETFKSERTNTHTHNTTRAFPIQTNPIDTNMPRF